MLEIERRVLHLRDHLGNVLKSLTSRVSGKDLELVSDVSADVPDTLLGDPDRLRQVLFNLVDNAIKFTERGEVVLRVRQQESTDEDVTLCFEVLDTGIGVPPDKQEVIFQEFVQADASTTRRYGGTGLGLAIASRLIAAMGGQISLSSEVGRGSTFGFTIRLGLGAVPGGEPAGHLGELDGLRTLVVDDNATSRRILAEMVRSWGFRVHTAPSVASAIDHLKRAAHHGEPVRLVLSDVQMPDADGFDLAVALEGDPTLVVDAEGLLGEAERRWQALLTERPDLRPASTCSADWSRGPTSRSQTPTSRGPLETLTRLTLDPAEDSVPVWTPDSQRVLFRSRREGPSQVFWPREADGTGSVERLTDHSVGVVPLAVSADGQHLLMRAGLAQSSEHWRDLRAGEIG